MSTVLTSSLGKNLKSRNSPNSTHEPTSGNLLTPLRHESEEAGADGWSCNLLSASG